jgi:hypothetical protein
MSHSQSTHTGPASGRLARRRSWKSQSENAVAIEYEGIILENVKHGILMGLSVL